MMRIRVVALAPFFLAAAMARSEQSLPDATIVVFNKNAPDSVELAKFYAQKRNIPRDHLVALDCSSEEEISRDQYDSTIAEPIRAAFKERQWWKTRSGDGGTEKVLSSTVRFVAIIKGVPLKIRAATGYEGDVAGQGPIGNRNDSSVDSELATLGIYSRQISGALNNPYYRDFRPITEFSDAPLLLVCRLDAPTAAVVRGMITDAIAAEKNGLWGRAFIDGAHNTSGGLQIGDKWMNEIVQQLHKAGLPAVFDDTPQLFPDGYPVSDCALYYGWYADHLSGAFTQSGFRFTPGAIAVHIHSYSASTLRDPNANWCAPLLMRGAAATVGNVYEPYLQLTTELDLLNDRLLHGFTFAESAYMATHVLSWMSVMIGDPLYRPFTNWTQLEPRHDGARGTQSWKQYHDFAVQNVSKPAPEFRQLARQFAARSRNGAMIEDIASMEARDGNLLVATTLFAQARATYSSRDDIVRVVLEESDAWIRLGKPKRALDLIRSVSRIVSSSPALPLLQKLEQEIAPKASPPVATPRKR